MSRIKYLTWSLLMMTLFVGSALIVRASSFEPTVNMLGFTSATEVGEQIEWMLTLSNTGDIAGQNIIVSNTVGNGLRIESVQTTTGTTSIINDNTNTLSIAMLEPDQTIQFNIITTVIAEGDFSNVSCVTASNLNGETCVRGVPVQTLPATGETPFWREPFLWLGVMTVSVSLVLIGLGLLGLQTMQTPDEDELFGAY